ncbi:MAG TPA: hypothetical protein VFL64_08225 [Rhizobacter sp.]|nr:hypothetical protein [Rhizobacter sp.]
MPLFHRSGSQASTAQRRVRPASPSCRGGASSMLRLAQPASPRQGNLTSWLSRAASVLAPPAAQALAVRPSEFAPSRWLVGH